MSDSAHADSAHEEKDEERPVRLISRALTQRGRLSLTVGVKLGEEWHKLTIAMTTKGFAALAKLPRKDRIDLFEGLATLPWRRGVVGNQKRKPRGVSANPAMRDAMQMARLIGPALYAWVKTAKGSALYKEVVRRLTREGHAKPGPVTAAAWLIEQNWRNAVDRAWPLRHPPTEDPIEFFKSVFRSPLSIRVIQKLPPPAELVQSILSGRARCFPGAFLGSRAVSMSTPGPYYFL